MAVLSVVIITLNEEANIGACLESVAWADEIVVLDSGSTDRTLDICRDRGARVFSQAWAGYAGQKNAAADLATGDWILSIDADERATPELRDEILKVVREDDGSGPVGYIVYRKVFYRNKWLRHGGFYPEKQLRLFRAGQGRFGERAVHESLEVDGPVGVIPRDLEHHTYGSLSEFIERMQQYSSLSAEEYRSAGRRIGPVWMSGRALFTFVRMYLVRFGFLDGYEGFLMAVMYGVYTFVKYAKLRELNENGRS